MAEARKNRFEQHSKTTMALLFGALSLVLLIGSFFLIKAVRDEVHRGVERYVIMREHRPQSDISGTPSKTLIGEADGLEAKPYRLRADNQGFIIPSKVHAKPDLSIVFLGGSTTECHYMGEEERFPYLAGRKLEEGTGLKVNALNGGYAGNNTLHMLTLLMAKVIPLKPQAVVFMECVNDANYLLYAGGYWEPHPTRGLVFDKQYGPVKSFIIRHFMNRKVVDAPAEDEFAGSRGKPAQLDQAAMRANYRANLELFAFMCRQHGITPVFMTQFNRLTEAPDENIARQIDPLLKGLNLTYPEYRALYQGLNQETREVAARMQVDLIDLDKLVPQDKSVMYDTVHLNANGSRLVADIVAERLKMVLKAPKSSAAGKDNP